MLAKRTGRENRVTQLKKINDNAVVLIDAADAAWAGALEVQFLK